MKAFLISTGTIFGLIVVAHVARFVSEPQTLHDPIYILLTVLAAGFSGWAWWLLRRLRP